MSLIMTIITGVRILTSTEYVEMIRQKDNKEKEAAELKQKRKEEKEQRRAEKEREQERKRKEREEKKEQNGRKRPCQSSSEGELSSDERKEERA